MDCVRVRISLTNNEQVPIFGWKTKDPNLAVTPLVERGQAVDGKYTVTHVPSGLSITSRHYFTSIDRAKEWAGQFEDLVPDELGRCVSGPFVQMLIRAVEEQWGVKVCLSAVVAEGGISNPLPEVESG